MDEIKTIDDRFLIGKQIQLTASFSKNMELIQAFWQTFHQEIRTKQLQQGSSFLKYGITFRHEQQLYYACAIPVKNTYPEDFQLYQLPRSTWLLFEHQGPMKQLPDTIHYLMKQYLPAHHYQTQPMDIIYYEEYTAQFHWNRKDSIIRIGIPLYHKPATKMLSIPAKSILQGNGMENEAWNWFGMDYNMNLYKGCCHGCIYCDSRSSCYQVEHFDIVRKKEQELAILELELKRKRKKGVVGIGAMSDTYNPYEAKEHITQNALRLLYKYGFGVGIDTKSDLILRDIPLLQAIAKQYPSIIKLTITCAKDSLSSIIEPHTVPSSKRFEALQKLHEAGLFAGILLMPILPFINDTEENIKEIVYLAHQHHAKFIYAYHGFGVTLRENQRAYFYKMLDQHFPGLRFLYEKQYHQVYSCDSPRSNHLLHIFQSECERYGILYHMRDIVQAYKQKPQQQLSLL